MGQQYRIKCASCNYSISISKGVGMMYSPNAVFYGRCDDKTQNWSVAFPDGYCEHDKPLLLSLVKDKRIKKDAFSLLSSGATPDYGYGHDLYFCPECKRIENMFYFKLVSTTETYEPDYKCPSCDTALQQIEIKQNDDDEGKLLDEFDLMQSEDNVIEFVDKNKQTIDWKCPKCGNDKLMFSGEMIMWD